MKTKKKVGYFYTHRFYQDTFVFSKSEDVKQAFKKGLHPKYTRGKWGDHEETWSFVIFYPRKSPKRLISIKPAALMETSL